MRIKVLRSILKNEGEGINTLMNWITSVAEEEELINGTFAYRVLDDLSEVDSKQVLQLLNAFKQESNVSNVVQEFVEFVSPTWERLIKNSSEK